LGKRRVTEIIGRTVNELGDIAPRIDQTLLSPTATESDVTSFIERSDPYGFRCLVVPPLFVKIAKSISRTRICTVAGFPNGYSATDAKIAEIRFAAEQGADEVDAVLAIPMLRMGRWDYVKREAEALVNEAHSLGMKIKLIIEAGVLSPEQVRRATAIVAESGADFVKSNTGFVSRGVDPYDIVIMDSVRRATRRDLGIKAAGGVRTAVKAVLLILLGADVIGSSSGIEIAKQFKQLRRGSA